MSGWLVLWHLQWQIIYRIYKNGAHEQFNVFHLLLLNRTPSSGIRTTQTVYILLSAITATTYSVAYICFTLWWLLHGNCELKRKKKRTKQWFACLFPSYFHSDKHYNSMHCQWHYSHWKIIKINQKRKITFLLVERKKKEEKETKS